MRPTLRTLLLSLATTLPLLTPTGRARAQAQQTLADQRESMVDLKLRGMRGRILLDSIAVWAPVRQSQADALADARLVLDSLKIPVSNATTHAVYHNNLVARGTLANQRLSTFLDCGWGMTGAHADEWSVAMGYAVFAKPATGAAGGTMLGVAIAGSARDNGGAAKAPVQCASTGKFEQLIGQLVRARGVSR